MPHLKSLPPHSQIYDVFAQRPDVYQPFVQMVERISRGPSPLSRGERELIGAFVSALNRCSLCQDIHHAAARQEGQEGLDATLMRELVTDITTAPVDERLKPLLAYIRKLTLTPERIGMSDAEAVRGANWSDEALHDAIVVACVASFMNRFVFGMGLQSDDAYGRAAGTGIMEEGYAARFRDRLARADDGRQSRSDSDRGGTEPSKPASRTRE